MSSNLSLFDQPVPTPVVQYGRYIEQPAMRQAVYDGTLISSFIYKNGGNPRAIMEFLHFNGIGDPFQLQVGQEVRIPQSGRSGFSRHPEA